MPSQESPAGKPVHVLLQDGALTGSWVLDPARSEVRLYSRHTWGLRPVHGVFREVTGNGTVTAGGQVSGTIAVAAGSVDTKSKQRDADLRSAKLFDVANHPNIVFTVDEAQPTGGTARVTGSLTVRGLTRPLSFDATVTAAENEIQLHAEVPVNRGEFGLTYNPLKMASLDNTITISAVFTR